MMPTPMPPAHSRRVRLAASTEIDGGSEPDQAKDQAAKMAEVQR
jgi:hypothetical protein